MSTSRCSIWSRESRADGEPARTSAGGLRNSFFIRKRLATLGTYSVLHTAIHPSNRAVSARPMLLLLLLSTLLLTSTGAQSVHRCATRSNCESCLTADADCFWCYARGTCEAVSSPLTPFGDCPDISVDPMTCSCRPSVYTSCDRCASPQHPGCVWLPAGTEGTLRVWLGSESLISKRRRVSHTLISPTHTTQSYCPRKLPTYTTHAYYPCILPMHTPHVLTSCHNPSCSYTPPGIFSSLAVSGRVVAASRVTACSVRSWWAAT